MPTPAETTAAVLRSMGLADEAIADALAPRAVPEPDDVCPGCGGRHKQEHPGGVPSKDWHSKGQIIEGGHHRPMPDPRDLKRVLQSEFRRQMALVLAGIKGPVLLMVGKGPGAWDTPIDLAAMGITPDMVDRILPVIELEYNRAGQSALARYGITDADDIWDMVQVGVREAAHQQTMIFCEATNAATSMELNAAIEALKREIAEGLVSMDSTVPAMVKRVRGVFDRASTYRAERIARTESSRAMHEAQRIAARESNVVAGFVWLASADACPMCLAIAEESRMVAIEGTFYDDPYEGSTGFPPAHPNCMCTVAEVMKGEPIEE